MNIRRIYRFALALAAVVLLTVSMGAVYAYSDASSDTDSETFYMTDEELGNAINKSRIGAVSGSVQELYVREHFPDANLLEYSTVSDVLAALTTGKVDYAILMESPARMFVRQQSGYRYCSNPVFTNAESFILSTENTELLEQINSVILRLKEDGTLDALYKKWASGDYDTSDIPRRDSGRVLKVSLTGTVEPLSFVYNGEIVGYDCDVISRIAYELGMRVEFTDMAFSSTISAVKSGKVDLSTNVAYTEERAKEVAFSEPYFTEGTTLVAKVSGESTGTGILDGIKQSFIGTFITESRWKLFVNGIGVTILISILAYILGTVLGLLLCAMLSSKHAVTRNIARAYGKIVTGIPILVWLMILYYMVFKGMDIPGIAVAVIGFGMDTGAALSGVFKTGLDSLDHGQIEAAEALGFLPGAVFRRIVFPQAAARVFDLYKGQFVSLVKSTSIVGYIAIVDLTKVSDIVRSRTYQAFFPLITTALIYFGITAFFVLLLSRLQRRLNPRLRRSVLAGIKTR